ncbi:10942_t:CDS:2, partial [Paraglomus occultum]
MANIKRQKQWGRNETLALLEIIKNYYKALNTAKSPRWQTICEQFDTLYPNRSEKAIRKRWEKLLADYKKMQDNNRRTGAERMEFEYQEEIQDIVTDDPVFNEVYDSANRT